MKLFIWTDVLCDYTCGMAVAYANTLEDALAKFPDCVAEQLGKPSKIIDCSKRKRVYVEYCEGVE